MKNLSIFVTILILAAGHFRAQDKNSLLAGTWQGTLNTPNGDLVMRMNIKPEGGGILVKMDVPAQRAKDIPASKAWLRNDSLFIEFAMMRAKYAGLLKLPQQVQGEWNQNNYKFPLVLQRSEEQITELKHSQEPVKPYAYHDEEVLFKNTKAGIDLAGTFTWPKDQENVPVAILISGSGPQDRDEALLGQKPFLVLADHLTKSGIAVLRFDDRGVGKSGGDFSKATSYDFSTDVEAAILYLKSRKEVNQKMIGLIGHSEGGMIAPMVASRSKDVNFMVLLAGPGIKGSELLILQSSALSKAAGMDPEQIKKNADLNKKIYEFACSTSASAQDSVSARLKHSGMNDENIKAQLKVISSPWFKYFLAFDPAPFLTKTKCPVLALNGTLDLQVPYKENLEGIENNLKKGGNKNHITKMYENLNHLFQHCKTGLPSEYATSDETMSPEVLKDISDWILKAR